MPTPTEFFRWYITGERTGKRRLTAYKLTRADALRAFPDGTPDLQSREVRNLPDRGHAPANSRPGSTSGAWEADAERD